MLIRAFLLLLAATGWGAVALAEAEREKIGRVGDWAVFRDGEGADLLCWVATRGQRGAVDLSSDAGSHLPGEVLVLFAAGMDEFSIELRGAIAPGGESWLALGEERFTLFFADGWGWSQDRERDAVLKAALAGSDLGTLNLGGASYRFSLDGFARALAEAEEACRR